ncbi:undecaprenyl-diphosphate phosphatase [Candidatus Woesearchaeota archaeon]|nr:undecaprenyl-diphosphate phosphatase [Candidatus Woesearchaeota archaeon]
MDIFEAVIIALIQGITEWLPISSEGFTTLFMVNFMGMEAKDAILLALYLHMGTVLASLIFFRKDVKELVTEAFSLQMTPRLLFLGFATVLSLTLGGFIYFIFLDSLHIDGAVFTVFIGVLLVITGLLQYFAKKKSVNKEIQPRDGWILGIAQAMATLPGISRSGTTVSTLLFLRYGTRDALKLSFLMGIPAVLVMSVVLMLTRPIVLDTAAIVSFIVSFLSGYITIALLMRVAEKINFSYFCIVFGLLSIGAAALL